MDKLSKETIDVVLKQVNANEKSKAALEEWLDFVLNYNDIFGRGYIGYWALGQRPEGGNVVWEKGADGKETGKTAREGRWEVRDVEDPATVCGELNRETMSAAYVYGAFACGGAFDWYESNTQHDANTYDAIIQMALFNSIVYG